MTDNHSEKEHHDQHGHSHKIDYIVDGIKHTWHQQYITGLELRQHAGIPVEKDIFLVVKKPIEDELITDDRKVDLALRLPELEHFISREKHHKVEIIVNGRKKDWQKHSISFWEVVKLAFPEAVENANTVYTVTFDKGPKENPKGTMSKGDHVYIKNDMVFNVTPTDKS